MKCPTESEILEASIDAPSQGGGSKLREHLATCAACRAKASEHDEVLAFLREDHMVNGPDDLEDRIMGALDERIGALRPWHERFLSRWRLVWAVAVGAAAVACFFLFPVGTPPGPEVATLLLSGGTVSVNDVSRTVTTPSAVRVSLREADTVRVGRAATASLVFPGRVHLNIEEEARLRVRSRKVFLEAGAVRVNLPKQSSPFEVAAPAVSVLVLGTVFRVAVQEGGPVRVELYEGSVRVVTSRTDEIMRAGHAATARANGDLNIEALASRSESPGTAESMPVPDVVPTPQPTIPSGRRPEPEPDRPAPTPEPETLPHTVEDKF